MTVKFTITNKPTRYVDGPNRIDLLDSPKIADIDVKTTDVYVQYDGSMLNTR